MTTLTGLSDRGAPASTSAEAAAGVRPLSQDSLPISSMTGFARSVVDIDARLTYVLTIKSVNHRFLDLQLRLPAGMDSLEMELRRVLKENLLRGHVELTLQVERHVQSQSAAYNRDAVAAYVESFRAVSRDFALAGEPDINTILRLPGVLQVDARMTDEDLSLLTASVLENAPRVIADLQTMRQREGLALRQILLATMGRLDECVRSVGALRPAVEKRYQERLAERLQVAVGPNAEAANGSRQRLLEEVALLVERSDVSEEIARLETHLQHFRDLLRAGGETGKKLDFLLQEMNREANTLLSKTAGIAGQGTVITELGLEMKAEIEKAREQIMNLE